MKIILKSVFVLVVFFLGFCLGSLSNGLLGPAKDSYARQLAADAVDLNTWRVVGTSDGFFKLSCGNATLNFGFEGYMATDASLQKLKEQSSDRAWVIVPKKFDEAHSSFFGEAYIGGASIKDGLIQEGVILPKK